jgi:hypothetical protein
MAENTSFASGCILHRRHHRTDFHRLSRRNVIVIDLMDSASTHLIDDICSPDPARVATALQAAAPRRETLAPVLLARLLEAASRPTLWDGQKNNPSPIFLLYLAAAWRETGAHPLLATLLRLPEKQCDAMLGDFITGGARRVLADTWPGDLAAIEAIALDGDANPYARGAALGAAALLTARGLVPREGALALFGRVAATPLDPDNENDVMVASELVSTLMDLGARELRGTVAKLFERDLVDSSYAGDEDEVLAELEPGAVFDPNSHCFPPPITDAWKAVKGWSFFDPLQPGRRSWTPPPIAEETDPPPAPDLTPPVLDKPWKPPSPYHAPPKVGRNDPCPCGSGKKFKKCCGA